MTARIASLLLAFLYALPAGAAQTASLDLLRKFKDLGGSLTFNQTYMTEGTYRLPAKANIAARFPGYSVDGTLTFSGYQPNASVSPSVFSS